MACAMQAFRRPRVSGPESNHTIGGEAMADDTSNDKKQSRPDFSNVQSGSSSTAPAPAHDGAATTYVVKPGDSLSKIAKHHYGDANQWHKIFEANKDRIQDPDLIEPRWTLRLP